MLRKLLAEVVRSRRQPNEPSPKAAKVLSGTAPVQATEFERVMNKLDAVHAAADLRLQREILFGGIHLGSEDMLALMDRCLADSRTAMRPAKAIHRYEKSFTLARYVLHTRDVPGNRAECGVFTGFVSLLTCRLLAQSRPAWRGDGYHLVDSFEGLSNPAEEDVPAGGPRRNAFGAGDMAASIEFARHSMRDFPEVSIHRGWIPPVLAELPEANWAFVHVDVDLYEPTKACLEYFVPRLSPGGVLICDDYGSIAFPGAGKAWDEYFTPRNLPFVSLSTAQSVYIREK